MARQAADGAPGRTAGRRVAAGDGWSVDDVLCTFGPADRPFEEQHAAVSIGIVVAGTFQYRSALGRDLLTPGSFLLGHSGECFECGHEHATGDRCIAFKYAPDAFERLAADAGVPKGQRRFRTPRLPPVRELSALVARAASAVIASRDAPWEELALQVAGTAIRVASGLRYDRATATAGAHARVSESIRNIERHPGARWALSRLGAEAGLSPFHYLRTFQQVTGVTPHQFVLRARLREAATRLAREQTKVIDIALDAGFGDISNFNHAFLAEFGAAPAAYRKSGRRTVVTAPPPARSGGNRPAPDRPPRAR